MSRRIGRRKFLQDSASGLGTVAFISGKPLPLRPRETTVKIDGAQGGRVFEGLGAVSAGASSRLLIDYPEPQRAEILDYLFKPNYGASLQHLKVEVGGDTNSTDGSEPSHMHTRTDENYHRGYEWWLMKEAKARNPRIILDMLPWGAPGWIGNGRFFSSDMANYMVKFIQGARRHYGLEIDYVGIWNEMGSDVRYIKLLKKTLLANGLVTKIVAADDVNKWRIVESMEKDAELRKAISAVGVHYPGYSRTQPSTYSSTPAAQRCGKPLWASEDGPWRGDWKGAEELVKIYNRNYIEGKMTKTEIWSPISSYYENLPLPDSGFMKANTPWSGHYDVQPAVWATAHTTQFVQPGWRYIDSACGYLNGKGSYVALKAPSSGDYSLVLETVDAREPQEAVFQVSGGLPTGALHVWRTNSSKQFEKLACLKARNGRFAITLEPDSIYSLTTTTGQGKGSAAPPPASPFPFPYAENFERAAIGKSPKYFSDQSGAFEVAPRAAGQGRCLRQVVNRLPISWGNIIHEPFTFLGSSDWSDYHVKTDVLLEEPGDVILAGRMDTADWGHDRQARWYSGYVLAVWGDGRWELNSEVFETPAVKLASGKIPFSLKTWHQLALAFKGKTIRAFIDGIPVSSVIDETHRKGMAGVGTGWNRAQFDSFSIS
ncbi:MAG TPA: galactosylceramidase [Terriglobia bacterium]|nr:galactosylceramidase [Terriglobia bacterium]